MLTFPLPVTITTTDTLRLYIGTENATNLAASTPAGGTLVLAQAALVNGQAETYNWGLGAWGAPGSSWGSGFTPASEITYQYKPIDKSCTLPVGVKIADAAGNESSVIETVIQIADIPQGVRNLAVQATLNSNEALLTWTASPDVN